MAGIVGKGPRRRKRSFRVGSGMPSGHVRVGENLRCQRKGDTKNPSSRARSRAAGCARFEEGGGVARERGRPSGNQKIRGRRIR